MDHLLPVMSLILLLGGACAGAQVRSGLVDVDGADRAVLATGVEEIRLVGPLARELTRVIGAHVKVAGVGGRHRLRVGSYQILDVGNGFFAIVGWVSVDQGGVYLMEWSTGLSWRLVGVDPLEFAGVHGAKIWVTGLQEGAAVLRPVSWGALTDPP